MHDRKKLRKKGLTFTHSLKEKPIMARTVWWQKSEAACLTAPADTEWKEMKTGIHLAFSFLFFLEH